MRTFALWLHIIGAGLWLGTNVVQAVVGPRLTKIEGAAVPWLRAVESASGKIYGTASALILLPGIYLVLASDDAYSFGSAFVGIGIAILIIGGALAGLVFTPKTRKAIGLFENGEGSQAVATFKSIGVWGAIDTVLVLFAILAMVAKWGA